MMPASTSPASYRIRSLPLKYSLSLKHSLRFLESARDRGDAVSYDFGQQRVVVFSHPDLINDVLVANHKSFAKESLINSSGHRLPSSGLGMLKSEDWQVHLAGRRILQPSFGNAALAGAEVTLSELTRRGIAGWQEGQEIDVTKQMRLLTTASVIRAGFGVEEDQRVEQAARDAELILRSLRLFTAPLKERRTDAMALLNPVRTARLFRAVGRLESLTNQLLDSEVVTSEEGLVALLRRQQEGGPLSEDIRHDAFLTLVAGIDTTTYALSWLWYSLAKDAAVEERLLSSLQAPDPQLARSYIRALFSETLRLYPPSWFIARRAIEECVIGGINLSVGDAVLLSPYVVQRDPRWWSDPGRFDPDRWLGPSTWPKMAFVPFSGGPRRCLGEGLAWLEAEAIVGTIAARWRLCYEKDVKIKVAAALQPSRALRMRLQRR